MGKRGGAQMGFTKPRAILDLVGRNARFYINIRVRDVNFRD
jgi:hypothetical protein